jgi:hypothetical protein
MLCKNKLFRWCVWQGEEPVTGRSQKITIDYTAVANDNAAVELYGWNVVAHLIEIR